MSDQTMTTNPTDQDRLTYLLAKIGENERARIAAAKRLSKLPTIELQAELGRAYRVRPTGTFRRGELIDAICDARYDDRATRRAVQRLQAKLAQQEG